MKLVSSGKAFAMEGALRPLVLALLIHCTVGDLSQILGRVPETAVAEEGLLERFVISLTDSYNFTNSEIVFLIQDESFDISAFSRFSSGKVLDFGRTLSVVFLQRIKDIPRVLKTVFWTRRTLFVLVMERAENDRLFVDMRYQSLDIHIVKAREIRKDFEDLVDRHDSSYTRYMKNVFRKFWDARIPNIIALAPKKSYMYIYTYFPYTELNCPDNLVPVLSNVWFSDSKRFYHKHRLFPDKMKNMHQCLINVTLINSPPGVMAEKGTIDGIEGELLKHIFRSLNATPRFHFVNAQDVSMNDSESSLNFLLENVNTGESELGAGFLIPTVSYTECIDQIHFGLSLCLTWVVPRVDLFNGFMGPIMDTFKPDLWKVFFSVTAVSSFVLWRLLRPKKFASSIFCIISITLGKSVPMPRNKFTKMFLLTFILYSTILSWAFQAGLGSNNIISRPPPQFESTREIIESGFEIFGVESAVQLFKSNVKFFKRNGQPVPVEAMDIYNALLKVAYQRKTAYLGLRLPILYHIQFLNPEFMDHVYVHSKCLLNFQPFFALRGNSPLLIRVRNLTYSLIENGIKSKLEEKYVKRALKPWRRTFTSKGDALVRGSFVIMWTGTVLSIFAFLAECVFYRVKKRFFHRRKPFQTLGGLHRGNLRKTWFKP